MKMSVSALKRALELSTESFCIGCANVVIDCVDDFCVVIEYMNDDGILLYDFANSFQFDVEKKRMVISNNDVSKQLIHAQRKLIERGINYKCDDVYDILSKADSIDKGNTK